MSRAVQLPCCTVYLRCVATVSLSDADLARDVALLDADESAAARRFLLAEDRRDYASAHALLRRMLSAASPKIPPEAWRFDRTDRQKPYIRPQMDDVPPMRFSLSHTRGLAACALSRTTQIGLDAERDSRTLDVDELATRVCSADETAQLDEVLASTRAARFLDLWTLKEAYVKGRGIGITDGLRTISFDLRVQGAVTASLLPAGAEPWWFALLKSSADSRVALTVAHTTKISPLLDAAFIEADGSLTTLNPIRTSAYDDR